MKSYKGRVLYKEAFTTDKIFVFDEDLLINSQSFGVLRINSFSILSASSSPKLL